MASWWARRAWAAAHVLLASALVGVWLSWSGVLIVVGTTVVPFWAVALVLLLGWTALRLGLGAFQVSRPSLATGWRLLLSTMTASTCLLVPLTAVASGFTGPSYVVVEPAGPGGCRVVVAEGSYFKIGSGTVHVAGGWGPFAPRVGSYSTDEGVRPVSTGSYSVSWNGRSGGFLTVDGPLLAGAGDSGAGLFAFEC